MIKIIPQTVKRYLKLVSMNSFYKRIKRKLNIKDVIDAYSIGDYDQVGEDYKTNDIAYHYDVFNSFPQLYKRTIAGGIGNGDLNTTKLDVVDSITKIALPDSTFFKAGDSIFIRIKSNKNKVAELDMQRIMDRVLFYDYNDGKNSLVHGLFVTYYRPAGGIPLYYVKSLDKKNLRMSEDDFSKSYSITFWQTFKFDKEPDELYYVVEFKNLGLFGGWVYRNAMNMSECGNLSHDIVDNEFATLLIPESSLSNYNESALHLPDGGHDLSNATLFDIMIKPQGNQSILL